MELTAPIQQNSIARAEQYPLHKDYAALMDIAYKRIATYSGDLWTNYNDSDPGITILQNLCYALTELGSKADSPIHNILTAENGQINYKNHFQTPLEILPSNPVTVKDFCKIVLDQQPLLKQVYLSVNTSFLNGLVIQPYLELKPENVQQIMQNSHLRNKFIRGVYKLLSQCANLGQVFSFPKVLQPAQVYLKGTIAIRKNEVVEKVLANIMFAANNLMSPYPVYKSYTQLSKEGRSLVELLDGPYLAGGYLEDRAIVSKRTIISVQEFDAALFAIDGIEHKNIQGISLKESHFLATPLDFGTDIAPYISIDSFKYIDLFVSGNKISEINSDKVQYYLMQLIPKQCENEINELLPSGDYRNLGSYYSIQNNFPSVYHLVGKFSGDNAHQAKIKQLKSYLLLLEQYMGNYLGQLENVPDLFSFESGRTNTELDSATYFTQPLYEVPGIENVLHGVSGYSSLQTVESYSSDWKAFRQDNKNPYQQQLDSTATSQETNLSRKLRALEHLLARCGKQYSHTPLRFINPRYGKDTIAEVEYLKQTLAKTPVLTANRARTYFKYDKTDRMACGLELNFENELDLRSFYEGIVEAIEESFNERKGIEVLYYNQSGDQVIIYPPEDEHNTTEKQDINKRNVIEVIWNDVKLISFSPKQLPIYSGDVQTLLQPHIRLMGELAACYHGCIVIDGSRLLNFLHYRWIFQSTDGQRHPSRETTFKKTEEIIKYLMDGIPIEVLIRKERFEVGLTVSEENWISLFSTTTRNEADQIVDQLKNYRRNEPSMITLGIASESNGSSYPIEMIAGKVIVFFPEWLSIFQQPNFRMLVCQKLMEWTPASTTFDGRAVSVNELDEILPAYKKWMIANENGYSGKLLPLERMLESKQAANTLVRLIANTAGSSIGPN